MPDRSPAPCLDTGEMTEKKDREDQRKQLQHVSLSPSKAKTTTNETKLGTLIDNIYKENIIMKDFNKINIQEIPDGDNKDFYKSFKEKLHDVEQFPSLYTFKFIVKSDLNKEPEIEKIFEHPSSKFSYKDSSGGKYKSITVETYVNNPDEVINYYKEVSKIESVIML